MTNRSTRVPYPHAYPARFEADDGAIAITFRDLRGANTFGADEAEAVSQAADCLLEALAVRIRENLDIPEPSPPRRGELMIPLPTLVAAKVALYRTMRAKGVSKSALARRVGCDIQQVRRLLNINHHSRLDQLDAAFAALDKRLVLEIRDAA